MVPCVRVKDGVKIDPLTPALARILSALDIAARWRGHDLTITCGREGHPAGDPHTIGRAVDVRVLDLTPDATVKFYQYIRSLLGDLFTVLYETPIQPTYAALQNIAYINTKATAAHFHIQLAKGQADYPPKEAAVPA